jgi:predicted cupin superfamily sugar epimerase
MEKITKEALIAVYGLRRHPEGGYFNESYRSAGMITAAEPAGSIAGVRNFSTAIYFLLPGGERSRLHRFKSDEVWHFYLGEPLTIACISPEGRVESTIMGSDIKAGQKLQYAIPAGRWFGAYHSGKADFSLVGCTVAPGFDFTDFELADRATLLAQFPHAKDVIEKLA